jgi:lipopolysaccharide export system permease protein
LLSAGAERNLRAVNTFDRHLLREWLQILALFLVAFCGLLFVQICYDDFRDMLDAGIGLSEFARYMLITLPSFLGVVLPLALLLSLLYALTKLHRANEFTAMRTAGIGFLRLTTPIWLVGVVACGAVWWLNSTIVPWSVEQSRQFDAELQFRKQARILPPDRVGAVYSVAFEDPDARRMWFFNRYRQASPERAYGVSVSELDEHGREVRRLVAAEAWYDAGRRGWVFQAGRDLRFDAETGDQAGSEPFVDRFEPGYHEDPRLMLLTDRRPRDLSFFELHRLIRYFSKEGNSKDVPYAIRYYSIIADTLEPLIIIAIAIPFAVAGVRVNPAVGVSKAIGLFLLYYIFVNVATALAVKQWVDPLAAAWLPNAGMAVLAAFFLLRLR